MISVDLHFIPALSFTADCSLRPKDVAGSVPNSLERQTAYKKCELLAIESGSIITTICDMKRKDVTEWESQWTSQRRLEQIATQRAELEEVRHQAGWRRNYIVGSILIVTVLMFLAHHFSRIAP